MGANRSDRVRDELSGALPAIVAAVLALGVLLRVRQYAGRRSLWLDELSIALNVAARGFLDLLRPLEYHQVAPPLFLWAEELATRIAGHGELTLRFVPLVCGIAVLPVAWLAARRLLEPWAAAGALLLLAVSPLLVYYANEVKPYSGDALAAAGLIVLALRTLDAPTDRVRWRWLLAGGVVALLGSTAAAFVLGGVGLALVMEPRVRHHRIARAYAAGTSALWIAVFVAVYVAVYHSTALDGHMQRYWAERFTDLDASLPRALWHEAMRLLEEAFLPELTARRLALASLAASALAALGAFRVGRRHGASRAMLLIGPPALAVAGSLLQRYPLEPRLLLFVLPPLALLMLAGTSALGTRRTPALPFAAFVLLFGIPAAWSGGHLLTATVSKEEIRAVLEAYTPRANGDPLIVFGSAVLGWAYYTLDGTPADSGRLRWAAGDPAVPFIAPTGPVHRVRIPMARNPRHPGWVQEEAERVRQLASPCAWLFFAHDPKPVRDSLLHAFAISGASLRREFAAPRAEMYRGCVGPAP